MDPSKMLEELLNQRRLIDATIASVEQLVAARKPRGRPSKAIMEARTIVGKKMPLRGRRNGSVAAMSAPASAG